MSGGGVWVQWGGPCTAADTSLSSAPALSPSVPTLSTGGELLEGLEEAGAYVEGEARAIFRQLLQGVQYLHGM